MHTLLLTLGLLVGCFRSAPPDPAPDHGEAPLIIGHRGAAGYLPEHTLASYERAVRLGADYIEPDLVATADGHLIARHDVELGVSTDVATRFPERRSTRTIAGEVQDGFFVDDFTLAEVKTLRARQAFPGRDASHDGRYEVPTLEEILALVKRLEAQVGRRVGLYPETKQPAYFRERGTPLEPRLTKLLARHGYEDATDPVFLQSFDPASLRDLAERTGLRRVLLVDQEAVPDLALAEAVAHGLGVHKDHVLPRGEDGHYGAPTDLVERAHAQGLFVHVYTFRDEAFLLAPDDVGDPLRELRRFAALGVDGVFTDFPDTAVRALRTED